MPAEETLLKKKKRGREVIGHPGLAIPETKTELPKVEMTPES
jgi:hypothetical protein